MERVFSWHGSCRIIIDRPGFNGECPVTLNHYFEQRDLSQPKLATDAQTFSQSMARYSSNWAFQRKFGQGSRPENFPAKSGEIACPFGKGKSTQRMLGVYPGKWSCRLVTS